MSYASSRIKRTRVPSGNQNNTRSIHRANVYSISIGLNLDEANARFICVTNAQNDQKFLV